MQNLGHGFESRLRLQMYSHIDHSHPFPKSLYKDRILWTQIIYSAVFFSTSGIWITAIPRHLKFNLGYNEIAVGLAAMVFSIAAVVSRPIVNFLGARKNRHELMFVALLLMMGSGLIAVISSSIIAVMISRVFAGVADGLFYVAISTLVVANADGKLRGRALNLYTVSLYVGITIGPVLGEQIYHLNQSRSFFLSGIACMLIAGVQLVFLGKIPSRYSEHKESNKKHAAFCGPAIFPGVIFVLGIVAWVGFEQFATLYGKDVGVNNVSGIFALIGISVIAIRLLASTVIDEMNIHLIIGIALVSSFMASMCFSFLDGPKAMYFGAIFLAISLGFFYPGFVLAAMRRGENYNSGSVLGTMGMFFDVAFGALPPIFGLIAASYEYSRMFMIAGTLIFTAMFLTIFLKIPPLSHPIDEGQAHSDVVL